jgi:hypothetical protein
MRREFLDDGSKHLGSALGIGSVHIEEHVAHAKTIELRLEFIHLLDAGGTIKVNTDDVISL